MAKDSVFWNPNIYEWRAYCELHPECDPKSTLLLRDGGYRFIPKEEAPLDDVAEGKRIQRERKEAEEKRKREEAARTKEEAEKESQRNALMLEKLRKKELKAKEYSKVTAKRHSAKMKAVTTDDPFEASVANAVDKDKVSVNMNYIIHAKRLSDLPAVELSDPEAIRDRVDWYYQLCATDGVRPNVPGLALAFGLTRTGLMNALADRRMTRDCAQEIGRGIAMMDDILSGMVLDGRIMPVAAIYLMNNWLGYKNASEVTTRTESVETNVDQKALEQKYQTVIDIE
jgi:hypothetical protein